MSEVRKRKSKGTSANARTEYHGDKEYRGDGKSFSVLDYIRIFGSLLIINIVLSLYVTGTPLWGAHTRWTNPRYVKFMLTGPHYEQFTEQQLAQYNGEDPNLAIYVAVNGKVYDVTSNPATYGPLGAYSFFSGRDAARAYVTGCFKTDLTHDLRGLNEKEAEAALQGWQNFYEKSHKYWLVGIVEHPPLTGDPPPPCNAQKAPQEVQNSNHP